MTPIEHRESRVPQSELLPLSLLNDFLYCSRRAALKLIEGWRSGNEHTARGDIVHDHADLPGYEVARGVTLLRALPVWSDRLGLSGKCDIVEVHGNPSEGRDAPPLPRVRSVNSSDSGEASDGAHGVPRPTSAGTLLPVEYKRGKRRQWVNDDVQLCAQALCLEEMFGKTTRAEPAEVGRGTPCAPISAADPPTPSPGFFIPRGAIFHAESKRRREVEFTAELRAATEAAASQLHELLESGQVPAAVFKPACEECSLYHICLPQATKPDSRARRLSEALFRTD